MQTNTQKTQHQYIIMFRPQSKSSRIKFHIPYSFTVERQAFKRLNSSFYHAHQKLWSIINTAENIAQVKSLFGSKLVIKDMDNHSILPKIVQSPKMDAALAQNHQKMVLKGLSVRTITTYEGALKQFFKYFESFDYKDISKEQIEGFLYHLISKYKISESQQNTMINAIKCYYEHTPRHASRVLPNYST